MWRSLPRRAMGRQAGPFRSCLSECLFPLLFALGLVVQTASTNKLASLAGTLKTFQRHECQGSNLVLQCPVNTTIDVLHANYGGARPPLCPLANPGTHEHPAVSEGRCSYPDSVKYKATTKVVDLCRRKRSCSVDVPSPWEISEEDPCPTVNKYIEVAYKCRPGVFINKILCQHERLTLNCGPDSRIAIYNALFGRTKDGSELCPQRMGLPEETCQANLATEIVMKDCHGAVTCDLRASPEVFGRPCPSEYAMYMKVVYTCVPSWILKPSIQERFKPDPAPPTTRAKETPRTPDSRIAEIPQNHVEYPTFRPPPQHPTLVPKVQLPVNKSNLSDEKTKITTNDLINCTVTILSGSRRKEIGIITEWMKAVAFINKHFEKFVLYIVIGLVGAVLLCLFLVFLKLLVDRRKLKSQAKDANQFMADIEDVDGDLDMMTPTNTSSEGGYSPTQNDIPPQPPRPSVVRYNTGPRLGSRYNDVDLIPPRSLSRENNHYFYS